MANKNRQKKKAKAKQGTIQQPVRAAYAQRESLFFQLLPRELRDKIYSHLFFSTRLAYGHRPTARVTDRIRIKSAPHALAFLRSCRRAKGEVGDTWLGQILFSFEEPEIMLDKLTALAPGTLSKIRHLRVRANTLELSYPGDDHEVFYRLVSALRLLPGLRLDKLTVLGCNSAQVNHDTLNGLIKESNGWKELHYISSSSEILGFERLMINNDFGVAAEPLMA